jgi:predicted molibdopterin-dependent oxidoreductase YjgC
MRIHEHPILDFKKGREVDFTCNGETVKGYEGETIAAALHAAGIKVLSHSAENHRPRGFYCAIGNCSSCLMEVDGTANVRVCTEPLVEGMVVISQEGKGAIK